MTVDHRVEKLLVHFYRDVLLRYRAAPDRYRVWEDDLDWPTFEGTGEPATSEEVTRAVGRGAATR